MEFKDIRPATFEEILQIYFTENGQKQDEWEYRNLERANEKFDSWIIGNISRKDIGEIVMPHYRVGGAHIIPETGAFLIDAYTNFNLKKKYFEKNNTQFCERIEIQKKFIQESGKVKTIYLSQEPLFLGTSYSGLNNFKDKITHLDGLHRLFALMELKEKAPKEIPITLAKYF
jgi:hypothetical protein